MGSSDDEGFTQIPLNIPASVLDQDIESDSEDDDPVIKRMAARMLEVNGKGEAKKEDINNYIVLPKKEYGIVLSSQLNSGITEDDTYLKKSEDFVVKNHKNTGSVTCESGAAPVDLNPKMGKKKMKKLKKSEKEKTKGKEWFDLPALEMTEERKADLETIQMRGALDPKRFYKKNTWENLPKYFQIGTVVDSPTEFYTSRVPVKQRKSNLVDSPTEFYTTRVPVKQRKSNLVDELLADAAFKKFNKRKYTEIIEEKSKKEGRKFFKGKKKKL